VNSKNTVSVNSSASVLVWRTALPRQAVIKPPDAPSESTDERSVNPGGEERCCLRARSARKLCFLQADHVERLGGQVALHIGALGSIVQTPYVPRAHEQLLIGSSSTHR
jgi:hypothetical protein